MIDQKELEKFGENIAKDFVQKNISLNDGLKKIASEYGLNKQQTRRVAESANVSAYLSLIKTAEDKYLKFDLANADNIHENIVKESSSRELLDYELPTSNLEVSEIFNLYKKAEDTNIDKIIENKNSIRTLDGEFTKQSNYLQGVVGYLDHKFLETQASFETNIEKLHGHVKQAVLQEVPFSDVITIIKTAAECTGEALVELYKDKLANRMLHIDFEKDANYSNYKPDTESTMYKLASQIDSDFLYAVKLLEAHEVYRSEYDSLRSSKNAPNMLKTAGFFNTTSDTFRWFKEHPKTTAAVAMLASYKAGHAMATKKSENKVPLTREAVNLRLSQYKVR